MLRSTIFTLAFLAAFPALAIDFTKPIDGPDGKPAQQCADQAKQTDCHMITLAEVASTALFTDLPSDRDPRTGQSSMTPEQKVKNAALALQILDAKGDLKLSAEQVSLLKARVGAAYSPLTVLRAWQLLDPNAKL